MLSWGKHDAVRELLRTLIREKGLNLAELSQAMGYNHAYMFQFLNQGKPRRLPEKAREELGRIFGVDPDRFRHPDDIPPDRDPMPPNLRLVRRADVAIAEIFTGLEVSEAVEAAVWSAVYRLLERDASGHPIIDDAVTLRIIGELVRRLLNGD